MAGDQDHLVVHLIQTVTLHIVCILLQHPVHGHVKALVVVFVDPMGMAVAHGAVVFLGVCTHIEVTAPLSVGGVGATDREHDQFLFLAATVNSPVTHDELRQIILVHRIFSGSDMDILHILHTEELT